MRKASKTARIQRKLSLLDERKPEIVSRTDVIVDSLRAYIGYLEQGIEEPELKQEEDAAAKATVSTDASINGHVCVLEEGEVVSDN